MPNQLVPEAEKDLKKKLAVTATVLLTLLALGILFTICRIGHHSPCAALLWAFAALVVGAIGGFLFAVPRVPRTDRMTADPDQSSKAGGAATRAQNDSGSDGRGFGLGINTNLEEISDWLTKMLVGIGLVQLKQIPSYVVRIGAYTGQSLGTGMESTASSIVIYFGGLGFLASYLLTRMFIGPAFLLADQATKNGVAYDAAQAAIALTRLNGDVNSAIEELAKSPSSPARIDQLIALLSGYIEAFPRNRRLNIVLARLCVEGKRDYPSAIRVLTDFIASKLKAGERDSDVADAFFNIACYDSLRMAGVQDKSILQTLETDGIAAIRQSIAVNSDNIKDFRTDPDLQALRDTVSGKQLLDGSRSDPGASTATGAPQSN